jgi:hypothetical protein
VAAVPWLSVSSTLRRSSEGRKEGLFQDVCAVLDPFAQFGKLVTKARYKQKLRLRARRTNSLCELKSVESGHDNITYHKVYCAIVLLAQAECLCTIGGRKDGKPVAFEHPVQKVSKVVGVFDQQDGGRRLTAGRDVKSLVR